MKDFLNIIRSFLQESVINLLYCVASAVKCVFDYLNLVRNDRINKEKKLEIQEAEKKLDNACDKGGIDDLFDAAEGLKRAKRS